MQTRLSLTHTHAHPPAHAHTYLITISGSQQHLKRITIISCVVCVVIMFGAVSIPVAFTWASHCGTISKMQHTIRNSHYTHPHTHTLHTLLLYTLLLYTHNSYAHSYIHSQNTTQMYAICFLILFMYGDLNGQMVWIV